MNWRGKQGDREAGDCEWPSCEAAMNAASVCGKFETSRRREPVALIVQGALPSFSCPGCDLVLGLPLFEMLGASRRFNVKPGGG